MRIVGGRFKGRTLHGPPASAHGPSPIRPTSDRLREALFDILAHAYEDAVGGARVIDLFAGTGALGLEAASRGARFVQFVETAGEARALVRANVEALGLGGSTRIFRRDATRLGEAPPGERFDLAFLDPPYGHHLAPAALSSLRDGRWLAPDALCVVEEARTSELASVEGYRLVDTREFGASRVLVLRAGA